MKLMRLIVSSVLAIGFLSAAAGSARASDEFSAEGGIPIASSLIAPGRYIAPRPSHFEDVVVKNWLGKTLLEGNIFYRGTPLPFSVEVKQHASGPDAFVADGFINQRWTSGATCKIAIKIEIQREKGQLFFRSYQPSAVLLEAPTGQECRNYNNYIWSFHEKAYVMIVQD